MIQAFRRKDSLEATATCKLKGLDSTSLYSLTNVDTGNAETMSGKELMEDGFMIEVSDKPQAALFTYKKVTP